MLLIHPPSNNQRILNCIPPSLNKKSRYASRRRQQLPEHSHSIPTDPRECPVPPSPSNLNYRVQSYSTANHLNPSSVTACKPNITEGKTPHQTTLLPLTQSSSASLDILSKRLLLFFPLGFPNNESRPRILEATLSAATRKTYS